MYLMSLAEKYSRFASATNITDPSLSYSNARYVFYPSKSLTSFHWFIQRQLVVGWRCSLIIPLSSVPS